MDCSIYDMVGSFFNLNFVYNKWYYERCILSYLHTSGGGFGGRSPPRKILDYGEENQDFLHEMLNM